MKVYSLFCGKSKPGGTHFFQGYCSCRDIVVAETIIWWDKPLNYQDLQSDESNDSCLVYILKKKQ